MLCNDKMTVILKSDEIMTKQTVNQINEENFPSDETKHHLCGQVPNGMLSAC